MLVRAIQKKELDLRMNMPSDLYSFFYKTQRGYSLFETPKRYFPLWEFERQSHSKFRVVKKYLMSKRQPFSIGNSGLLRKIVIDVGLE
jgi:hypothetical protein